ncbi:LytR/AlgR family response regulator transcription factor [Pendulispora albinea]|uniref:LytTR family DNA-binding domain-containing protein n=1 Tax=Pendulispora albinea TaxID=2741071 RepID=A0ABZ2LPX5_9BACT
MRSGRRSESDEWSAARDGRPASPDERLRAVVVDDEPLARARLCRLLARTPDIDVIAECGDGRSAVATVSDTRPELLFLDVEMPELDGFEVLATIGTDAVPALIFVTAFDHYAVRAFDAHAVDYLIKPFDAARLDRALTRARKRLTGESIALQLTSLLAAVRPSRGRLAIPVGDKMVFVDWADIDYLEAEGNYVAIHVHNAAHLVRDTLSNMEARLDPAAFVRIHRSRIVRIDRVRAIEPLFHGEYRLTLHSGAQITSARGYRDALRAALGI